jgi:predicted dehydrogenase
MWLTSGALSHYFYRIDNRETTSLTGRARIGVIGTGWWATSYHLPTLADHPRAEVVGVADLDERKAEAAAARYGIPQWFADYRSLLDLGVDGIVVATPHSTHFALARDALAAGADVLVEKPMVVEPEEARELVGLARRLGRRLHVGYPFPYTRHAQTLRGLVEDGALGEVLTATGLFATSVLPLYRGVIDEPMHVSEGTLWPTGESTYSDPDLGGGQLLTQVTHCASLLLHLTGWRPRTVFGQMSTYDTRVDDWDGIVFKTGAGAVGTITSTGTVALHDRRVEQYRLFGSEGHAVLDTAAGTLRVDLYDGDTMQPPPLAPDEIYPARAPAARLVDSLVDDEPVLVPGELGLLTVELLAAARASSQSDSPVTLEPHHAPLTPDRK